MRNKLPKLYRLVKASDAKAISFFTIEGHNSAIGLIVSLYKENSKKNCQYLKEIISSIQKLAILLDYEKAKK